MKDVCLFVVGLIAGWHAGRFVDDVGVGFREGWRAQDEKARQAQEEIAARVLALLDDDMRARMNIAIDELGTLPTSRAVAPAVPESGTTRKRRRAKGSGTS